MRREREWQLSMFEVFNLENRVPDDHPLREIGHRWIRIIAAMIRDFDRCYGSTGRVGIPSKRRLCEACELNILYRWFLGWPLERPMWTPRGP